MKSVAIAAVLVCVLVGQAEAADLGERGAMSINGAFAIDITSTSSDAENDTSATEVLVSPNGDLFVAPGVSLGGGLLVDYRSAGDFSSTAFGLQARAGYYLPLGSAGIWVMAGFDFLHGKSKFDSGLGTTESSTDTFALDIFAPIVIHLAPNFFFGLGPTIKQDLVYSDDDDSDLNNVKRRVLGVTSIVGGVW
jgi:hypothetical protein